MLNKSSLTFSLPLPLPTPQEIPELYNYMSHQIIDVSTIMNLSGKWKPDVLVGKPDQQGGSHRAMSDVVHSIETLKYFKAKLW